jgi:hypothetical protein
LTFGAPVVHAQAVYKTVNRHGHRHVHVPDQSQGQINLSQSSGIAGPADPGTNGASPSSNDPPISFASSGEVAGNNVLAANDPPGDPPGDPGGGSDPVPSNNDPQGLLTKTGDPVSVDPPGSLALGDPPGDSSRDPTSVPEPLALAGYATALMLLLGLGAASRRRSF